MEYQIIKNKENPLCGLNYEEVTKKIQEDGYIIRFVRNQTEELCKLAVQRNSDALQYVHDEFIYLFE